MVTESLCRSCTLAPQLPPLPPDRIAAGENVHYVSRQLGHASTKLTLDSYGRWLPARSTTAAHTVSVRSGDQAGVETVTNDVCSAGERA